LKGKKLRAIAVEPASMSTLTKGEYATTSRCCRNDAAPADVYAWFGFYASSIHAGGLRYHGMSPIISRLYLEQLIEAQAYEQTNVFEAASPICAHGRELFLRRNRAHAIFPLS